jgi:ketosteroid isomerase-like protein
MQQQKATATSFLDAIANVDGARMREVLSPETVLHTQQSNSTWAGIAEAVIGADAITTILTAHHGAQDPGESLWKSGTTRWHHEIIIGEGDLVVIQSIRKSITAQGADYQNLYVWIFRFDDAKICEIWEHCDTAYALSVLQRPTNPRPEWRGLSRQAEAEPEELPNR